MNKDQILELASQHLEVLICEDNGDGECPTDFAATSEQLLKFAKAIYEKGRCDGVNETNAN